MQVKEIPIFRQHSQTFPELSSIPISPLNIEYHDSLEAWQRDPFPITFQLDPLLQILARLLHVLFAPKDSVPHEILRPTLALLWMLLPLQMEIYFIYFKENSKLRINE